MDNNQNQTPTNNNSSNTSGASDVAKIASTNQSTTVASDILNTQQVDPFSLSQDQMAKDLALLKEKDVKPEDSTTLNNPTEDVKPKFVPFVKMNITELDVLRLKNPFKGE